MNRLIIIAFGILLSADLLAQGVVRPKQQRESVLARAESILEADAIDSKETVDELENPFVAWIDPASIRRPEAAAPAPKAERLSDAAALEHIGAGFRPSGSMIGARTAFLNLPGGRSLELGQTFSSTVRGETYEVTVENITMRGYTLRLGSATMTREFLQDRMGSGTITRPVVPETNETQP